MLISHLVIYPYITNQDLDHIASPDLMYRSCNVCNRSYVSILLFDLISTCFHLRQGYNAINLRQFNTKINSNGFLSNRNLNLQFVQTMSNKHP